MTTTPVSESRGPRSGSSTRRAGMLGVIGGVAVSIGGGTLVASAPWSILGAVIVVAGTILFSVGLTWLARRSWNEGDWPTLRARRLLSPHRLRRLVAVRCVVYSILIGVGLVTALSGVSFGWLLVGLGAVLLGVWVYALRALSNPSPLS